MRVLLLESIHPVARQCLTEAGLTVELIDGALSLSDLGDAIQGVQAIGIRSKTQVPRELLEASDTLLAVGAFCIGTNQIDLTAASCRGVGVFNAPFSNTRSVAELVLAEVVMLARQLADRIQEMHAGQWRKVAKGAHEVRGKTLGIVGYGHIGRQVGVLAEAVGMRVLFHDIAQRLPMGNNTPFRTLKELLTESDFVTLHVPATEQTKGLLGKEELAWMKPGASLLNASRGSVVDISALADALRGGHVSGAAIDVFPEEPQQNVSDGFESELRGLSNVVLTPHIGGSTAEAQENIGREVSEALVKFLKFGSTEGSVNFPPLELPSRPESFRVSNVHRNVPGVLGKINHIVSEKHANVQAQVLGTNQDIGYLLMDVERDVRAGVCEDMAALEETISVRAL